MTQTAILVFSGKVLDRPFALDSINYIRNSVERALAERGVVVTRRVVTLNGEKHLAAPFFLSAGFEVQPADDEDMQASALVSKEVFGQNPPDEVVLMMGVDEPIDFLRLIGGRTRRTIMRLPTPNDQGISYDLGQTLEGIVDIREALSKEGVDWNTLDLRPWSDWQAQFDSMLSSDTRDVAHRAVAQEPTQPALPLDEASDAAEREPERDAAREVDALIEPTEEYERLAKEAPMWNEELIEYLTQNNLQCSAFKATERLDLHFHGINNFFLKRRADFQKLLAPEIKLITDSDGVSQLCHVDHPDMATVAPAQAVQDLNLDTQLSDDRIVNDEPFEAPAAVEEKKPVEIDPVGSFKKLSEQSQLLGRMCEWAPERLRRLAAGGNLETDVKPQDQEFAYDCQDKDVNPWLLRPAAQNLKPEDYVEASKCYGVLSRALLLLSSALKADVPSDSPYVGRILQVATNAQCCVKSFLNRNNIALGNDPVQRAVHNAISDYLKVVKKFYVENLKLDAELPGSAIDGIASELDALEKEVMNGVETVRGRKKSISRIKYHVEQLDKNGSDSVNDWNKIVESVTDMVKLFGEKPSSLLLRDALIEKYDCVPDEVETTDEFCDVVQQIEEYVELEREKEEEAFLFASTREEDPQVTAVRNRYEGKKVVFIGGTPVDHVRERLEKAFGCTLIWEQTSHGESLDRMKPYLRDADVAAFVIYIPWCSHKHSEELVSMGKPSGKDFIRVRKGTSPQLIAQSVCDQTDVLAAAAEDKE